MKKALSLLALVLILAAPVALADGGTLHGGITRASGAAGSFWTTDLVMTNAADSPASVVVEILGAGFDREFYLSSGEVLVVRDLVSALGLAEGSYAAKLRTSGEAVHAFLSTSTPSAIGGSVAVQLPALEPKDDAPLPLVSPRDARAAVYVVAENGARWRVIFFGTTNRTETVSGSGGLLNRIEPPPWANRARFERLLTMGAPRDPQPVAAAYVTFADNVTNAPEIVQ